MITCHISSVLTHTFFHIPLFMFHTAPIKGCVCVCARTRACALAQSCPTLWNPMYYSPSGSSVHEISLGKNPEMTCHFLLQGIFSGIEPMSPALAGGFFTTEPPGKPY